ncbi:MAG: glycosyltransferase family 2 protein [Rickettsiales bacterium]|nr:glycosyltransferase family 2 protein [Rickettsiales bacterium]
MKHVLIIIPCLNEKTHLEPLVRQLLADTQAIPHRFVIADGGSTDGTVEIARNLAAEHEHVYYLHNPRRLQSAAINLAVARYGDGCEYLVRIDAHAEYPARYVQTLAEEAQTHQAASVVVAMDTRGGTPLQRAIAAAQNSKLGNGGSAHRNAGGEGKWPGKWVDHGHHALMRIDAFRDVKGYDETFSHNEDAELDTRLRKQGYTIWLTGKTHIVYYPRDNYPALFRQYRNYGAGRLKTILKHRAKPKLRQMLPVCVFPAFMLFLLCPLWLAFALPFLAYSALCLGYGALIAWKARDKDLLQSGPAAMLMHFAWSVGFWRQLIQTVKK